MPSSAATSASPSTLLIVQEHATLRRALALLLEREGYQISLAASLAEALALVNRSAFALVITSVFPNVSADPLAHRDPLRLGAHPTLDWPLDPSQLASAPPPSEAAGALSRPRGEQKGEQDRHRMRVFQRAGPLRSGRLRAVCAAMSPVPAMPLGFSGVLCDHARVHGALTFRTVQLGVH